MFKAIITAIFRDKDYRAVLVFLLVACISFFIPLSAKAVPYFIALLTIVFFFYPPLNEKLQTFKKEAFKLFLFLLYYIIYLLGAIYSSDSEIVKTGLLLKIPFVLFPLIFCASAKIFTERLLYSIFYIFVFACIAGSLFLLANGLWQYNKYGQYWLLLYTNFSLFFHPSYYGLFINFALALLLFYAVKQYKIMKWVHKVVLIGLALFFLLIIVLLNSKAIFVSTALIIITGLAYITFIQKRYKLGLLLAILLSAVVAFSVISYPTAFKRVSLTIKGFYSKDFSVQETNATFTRLQVWQTAGKVAGENIWLGLGPGDVSHTLVERYKEKGFHFVAAQNLNAHNQFLQTLLVSGLFGLLALLTLIGMPFYFLRNSPYFLLIVFFTIIITVNFFVESMLQRQAGVVFFTFFSAFFIFILPQRGAQ